MQKFILGVFMVFGAFQINAQVQTPQPSPSATIVQTVGLTEVSIEYSRPSLRGRAIFGALVPYDEIWRTGANENTVISFSDAVIIGGQTLPKGSYSLYSQPGKDSWVVYFYTTTDNWGNPENWDTSKVAAQLKVTPVSFPFKIETFTLSLDNLNNTGAVLGILWENTYVGIPFEVPTEEKAMASIEDTFNGPTATDYFAAAVYYFENGKDLKTAEQWVDKAVAEQEQPAYWMLYQQSLIQQANGNTKKAIATAKQAMKAAEAAGNPDYVRLNQNSIQKWEASR
jgi:hypothetical protein